MTPESRIRENERRRQKLATDPIYRARKNELQRQRLAANSEHTNERRRQRRVADPEYNAQQNERRRQRYATDPEYRDRAIARNFLFRERMVGAGPEYRKLVNAKNNESRRRRFANPEYRKQKNAQDNKRRRQKLATDPEYKKLVLAQHNERWRQRYATDPEFRDRTRDQGRQQSLKHYYKVRAAYLAVQLLKQTEQSDVLADYSKYKIRLKLARKRERQRQKRATDPEYKKWCNAKTAEWAGKNRECRLAYAREHRKKLLVARVAIQSLLKQTESPNVDA